MPMAEVISQLPRHLILSLKTSSVTSLDHTFFIGKMDEGGVGSRSEDGDGGQAEAWRTAGSQPICLH